ncbi:uncharacterized protein C8Q71DRAFT_871626 [Rhodofomes roseus]|uniref:Uncharacterized protein n=1 Tax=Rhodofomes roseus TaxID=34475 RepID=A0ABQ8KCB6_9APHY|nr:uncharacterized protein C8Q71DRAFT_871626 [Rhodofomes roseus]KAH9834849.1 hypothetical protein C8Q71DRAFT_871626 [Rhodofomes roseus]
MHAIHTRQRITVHPPLPPESSTLRLGLIPSEHNTHPPRRHKTRRAMRPTTPVRRVLNTDALAASLRSSTSASTTTAPSASSSARRQLATVSADLPQGVPELRPIFDIFDAPARLGTSPARLRLPQRAPSAAPSPRSPATKRPTRLMMPSPIIFDGPSGTPPRSPPASASTSASSPWMFPDSLPHTLPPPETFDGPAYVRGPRREVRPPAGAGAGKKSPRLTPFLVPLLGMSGAAGLFGMNEKGPRAD